MVSRVKRWERRREGIREGRLGRIGEGSRNGEGRWVIRSAIVTRSLKRRIVELVIEFSSISNWTSSFPFFLIIFFFLLILVSVVNSKNLLMGSESLCLSSEKSEEENKVQNC